MHRHAMTLAFIVALGAALAAALAACGRPATPPQIPRDADAATREAIYTANELTYVDRFFGPRAWKRADGTYSLKNVRPAVDMYPASRESYAKVRQRTLSIALISATGGALIGFTAGMQLTQADGEGIANNTAFTLYGAGALLVIIGVALDRTWARDAAREMAATYNADLRYDLKLPER